MAKTSKPSLAETHPELAAQADGWDPATLAAGSASVVGWKCEQGHTWQDSVSHRSLRGSGCPVCSGHRLLAGFNDLATINPGLAAQVFEWDPTTLAANSSKMVGWICGQGHTWQATVASRSRGRGCPVCSNTRVVQGVNDLSTTNPVVAEQAFEWDPTTVVAGSHKKVEWRCEQGHIWAATVKDRSFGYGCPFCSGLRAFAGYNDLATTNPELAAQAFEWDPTTLSLYSHKKVGWQCEQAHIWKATVASRSSGSGCPICSGHQVLAGYNDLATTNPELAAQAFEWDPTTLSAGSQKKVGWQCEQGHTWKAGIDSRSRGDGCPICSGRQVLAGYNDLATTNPELAAQAFEWDPTTLTNGSGKIVGWICEQGHTWQATVNHRTSGYGCAVCNNKRVLQGVNDLATTNPELAKQAFEWDPTTKTAGSSKKVGWQCEQGHTYKSLVKDRSRGIGCPICSGHQVLAGYNDLATTNPELAAQAFEWDPTTLSAGSQKKVGWQCTKGHIWKAIVKGRSNGKDCPTCAWTGFDPNQSGWLYLIDHDALTLIQIGISNFPAERISSHVRRGWEVMEVRGPMEGHLAQQLETAILHAVERRGAVLGHKARIEKFDGYSEAWLKDSLKVKSIKQLLDWVYEDESQ